MEQEENVKTLAEYFEIVNRRKNLLIISFLVIGFLGVVLAIKLPPVFRSSATILIEDQQIPQSMVATTITDFADKRIQLIKQRVMTRDRILSIIQKHKLYLDKRDKLVPSELVSLFQEDVSIDMISADVRDPKRGGIGKATIAFSIAFNYRYPVIAQAVTNELVSLFLNENTRVRSQRAAKTTDFLKDEAEKLKKEITDVETRIMEFKAENSNSLPEMLPNNLAGIDRAKEQLRQADVDIRVAQDRVNYLTESLLRAKEEGPSTSSDQPLSKAEQLRQLKAQYIHLNSLYRSKHPDLLRVKRQIQNMDPGFTGELSAAETNKELKRAEDELVLLQKKYPANHPDVVKQLQRVDKLNQDIENLASQRTDDNQDQQDVNPLYISLSGQLSSTQLKIDYLFELKTELQERIKLLQTDVDKTPLVEKQYTNLNRMRSTSLNKYAELEAKYRAAKLAQTLEEEQKGETFTLIEPPIAAEKPVKPNRQKIAIMGLALGIGVGFGLIVILELMNEVIRGPKSLERLTGIQPIVVIPYIETPMDIAQKSRRKKWTLIACVIFAISAVLVTHFFVMPLEIIWSKLMIKLSRI